MSNVPMTRPIFFHSSTFAELKDGRILQAAGAIFTTSDDGGITWSDPFSYTGTDGDKVGGSGASRVRLSGRSIGLAAMRRPDDNRRNTYLFSGVLRIVERRGHHQCVSRR